MRTLGLVILTASAACFSARAQSNAVITSFSGNGVLTWTAPENGVYSVEWASSLTGAWHRTWDMADMAVSAGSQTNHVPMFYRITPKPSALLMHGNGSHGSTNFIDQGGRAIAGVGDARLSTNRSRFGSASIYFDGSGDYLNAGANADWAFGTGDFTVDFWVNFDSAPGDFHMIGPHTQGSYTEWCVLRESGHLRGLINGNVVVGQAWTPALDTWYHIALTRSGSTVRLFVNGEQLASGASSATIGNARPLTIGATVNPSLFFRGYMDEIRVVKGAAAWTAPFTPPADEYAY